MGKKFSHNLVFHVFLALCRFRSEEKQPNLDESRDFDPLGVEIELRCARSSYGGTGSRQNPKIPNRFPKNCI